MVDGLVILCISIETGYFVTLKFNPTLLLHVIRKGRLDLNHLFELEDNFGWEPSRGITSLKAGSKNYR